MAFSASIGERGDDLRFRNPQSPRDESSFPPITSPLRSVGSQLPPLSSEARGQLHRRFTTNNIPTLSTPLSPIGQQRRQAAEPTEFTTATYHKLQVLEKKKLEYEYLKEQRRRFEAEMELLDLQSRQGEEEINRLSSDIQYGKHSQPTTPPEYTNTNGFPTALSRPNRFSMSSINSSSGQGASTPRGSRSGSLMTSPPPSGQGAGGGFVPSKSVPGSRRNSDEEGDSYEEDDDFTPLSPAAAYRSYNRMSMPVTNLDLRGRDDLPDLASVLGHINTTDFLFADEDKVSSSAVTSPDGKFGLNGPGADFPSLLRGSDVNGNVQLSANSAALDLALSQSPGPEVEANSWSHFSRHRHSQPSLPINALRKGSQVDEMEISQVNGNRVDTTPVRNNRRSVEFGAFSPFVADSKRSSLYSSPGNGATNGMPKLQSSYSTNDVPTLKNGGLNGTALSGTVNSHAEQHLHNHNASIGRIPPNVIPNRHSRELSNGFSGALHASAAPFGPILPSVATAGSSTSTSSSTMSPNSSQYTPTSNGGAYYGGLNLPLLTNAMGALSMNGQVGAQSGYNGAGMTQMYQQVPYPYNPYATYGPNGRLQDSQARVIQSRRLQNEDSNRFMNYDLKTMPRQEIYNLCKDQHGCRFLQKKLEERNAEYLQIIFDETAPHVVELMTDPFGNYLCQKLLEFTTHEQRNTLVRNAAPALVTIALNQHGTRALQKMIEFISTREQINMIIKAFSGQVVELIKDLNGNHVIQKCLNHLKAEDAQFIFDAVGANCVVVGTHRHGCCVLQRCIDHASGFQKVQLIRQITANSIELVQDPFGNYVVQYILDLNDASFTTPLCMEFRSRISELSKQKFSSNVIEKCIRCADPTTKRIMIEELMDINELEKLMRDSYGNYVIQTALEFAPPDMCIHLIENMRPILPAIRQTPYGRRIQSKVQERETRLAAYSGRNSGHVSPHTLSTTQSPEMSVAYVGTLPVTSAYGGPPVYAVAANYTPNIVSPQPHRLSNPPLPSQLQNSVQQQGFQYFGGMAQFGEHFNGQFNGQFAVHANAQPNGQSTGPPSKGQANGRARGQSTHQSNGQAGRSNDAPTEGSHSESHGSGQTNGSGNGFNGNSYGHGYNFF